MIGIVARVLTLRLLTGGCGSGVLITSHVNFPVKMEKRRLFHE